MSLCSIHVHTCTNVATPKDQWQTPPGGAALLGPTTTSTSVPTLPYIHPPQNGAATCIYMSALTLASPRCCSSSRRNEEGVSLLSRTPWPSPRESSCISRRSSTASSQPVSPWEPPCQLLACIHTHVYILHPVLYTQYTC